MANTTEQKNQLARINRKLAPKYQKVLSSRSERERQYLGDYYVLDSYQNAVIDTHVELDSVEAELSNIEALPVSRSIDEERREVLTMRLLEQFHMGVYPNPWEFSEEEIDCIAGWAGEDDKGTFPPGGDEELISAYDLNVASGENTYPKFAEILRSRKANWDEQHRADANLRRGERLLEAAVDACVVAGMSKESITQQVDNYCDLNGH